MGLPHTNGQHHQHQLRTALVPHSTGQHHEHQLANHWVWHTRTASITSISCELLWCCYQQVSIESIRLDLYGSDTHERPASRASAANLARPRNRQASIASISCELLWTDQHHGNPLRSAVAPPSTSQNHERVTLAEQRTCQHHEHLHTNGPHHEHQLRCIGPAINNSASRASAANFFGAAFHEHQLANHWVWHTRTASITACFGGAVNKAA